MCILPPWKALCGSLWWVKELASRWEGRACRGTRARSPRAADSFPPLTVKVDSAFCFLSGVDVRCWSNSFSKFSYTRWAKKESERAQFEQNASAQHSSQ